MPPDPAPTDRWIALDAMRGVAALIVVFYHLRWDWHGYALLPVRHGFYAVDFFFVLSGFVMAATYGGMRTGSELARFALKRAGRLLPLHACVLFAFVVLESAFSAVDLIGLPVGRPTFSGFTAVPPLIAQATMTFGLIPGLDWLWNHPCWSIAVEFWTYILFGLTVLAPRRGHLARWAVLSGLGLVVVAYTPEGLAITSGAAIFRCLLSFFLGSIGHAAYVSLRRSDVRLGFRAQLAAAMIASAAIRLPASSGWSLLIPFTFVILILCLAFDEGGVSRTLCTRPLMRLGELSFSIYLVHVPIWFALEGVLRIGAGAGATWLLPDAGTKLPVMVSPLGSTYGADILVLVYVALVLVVSTWTHRRIEEPARRWSRRGVDRMGAIPIGPSDGASPATICTASTAVMNTGACR